MNEVVELPYHVSDVPEQIFSAWSRTCVRSAYGSSKAQLSWLLHTDRLQRMRDTVLARPLIQMDNLVEAGSAIEMDEQKLRVWNKTTNPSAKNRNNGKNNVAQSMQVLSTQNEKSSAHKTRQNASKVNHEVTAVALAAHAKQQRELDYDDPEKEVQPTPSDIAFNILAPEKVQLLRLSPVARLQIGLSASSKMNYILSDVLRFADHEKFLIFSQSTLTLAHVAEGLELVGIKSLMYSTSTDIHQREQFVTTFETSDVYRVLLMDLKHGARGL